MCRKPAGHRPPPRKSSRSGNTNCATFRPGPCACSVEIGDTKNDGTEVVIVSRPAFRAFTGAVSTGQIAR